MDHPSEDPTCMEADKTKHITLKESLSNLVHAANIDADNRVGENPDLDWTMDKAEKPGTD